MSPTSVSCRRTSRKPAGARAQVTPYSSTQITSLLAQIATINRETLAFVDVRHLQVSHTKVWVCTTHVLLSEAELLSLCGRDHRGFARSIMPRALKQGSWMLGSDWWGVVGCSQQSPIMAGISLRCFCDIMMRFL